MLREALDYLLTPCAPQAKALGYLYESVALQARARRLKPRWLTHIANCQAVIRQAAHACQGGRAALVCGSGLLLETPMDALLKRFGRIDCLDIVQPRGLAKGYPPDRVRLIECDLSGVIAPIADALRGKKTFDPDRPPPAPEIGDGYDLVVSCNLASQLPLLPVKALGGQKKYPQTRLDAFGRNLVLTHLRWLAALPGVACLITDTERLYQEPNGQTETEDALWGVGLNNPDRQWWWDIAPAPELGKDLSQRNRVAGIAVLGEYNTVTSESGEEPSVNKGFLPRTPAS